MTWHTNRGQSPRDKSAIVAVRWACGVLSKWTFRVSDLRWSLTDSPFDVGQFAKVEA